MLSRRRRLIGGGAFGHVVQLVRLPVRAGEGLAGGHLDGAFDIKRLVLRIGDKQRADKAEQEQQHDNRQADDRKAAAEEALEDQTHRGEDLYAVVKALAGKFIGFHIGNVLVFVHELRSPPST